tara:strand:- start:250 stop:1371 length:1122 start_codon:yes stop_codon:yes gene_type:complete
MPRNTSIDYLRNFANLCRCIIHAAIPYMVTKTPIWPVNDKGAWFFDIIVFEIHLFVMELFFVISGFIFMMFLSKESIYKVIINRIKRIVIPFILGLLILVPIVLSLFSLSNFKGYDLLNFDIVLKCYIEGWKLAIKNLFPTAHLWFLFYLIIFYVIAIIFKKHLNYLLYFSLNQLIMIGIIISSLCMFFMDRWIVDNPLTLTPEIPSLIHYLIFFLIGIIFFKSSNIIKELMYKCKKILLLGFFISFIAILPQLYFENTNLYYYKIVKLSAILLSCSATYLLVIGFWGIAYKINFTDSKALRYISESSYWIYIINMPIVAFIQIVLISFNISIFLKFLIALTTSLVISIISYEYFVRYTYVGALLNKKRNRIN